MRQSRLVPDANGMPTFQVDHDQLVRAAWELTMEKFFPKPKPPTIWQRLRSRFSRRPIKAKAESNTEYERAMVDFQRSALRLLEALPAKEHQKGSWSTPMIVASLSGDGVGENFIARVERWSDDASKKP